MIAKNSFRSVADAGPRLARGTRPAFVVSVRPVGGSPTGALTTETPRVADRFSEASTNPISITTGQFRLSRLGVLCFPCLPVPVLEELDGGVLSTGEELQFVSLIRWRSCRFIACRVHEYRPGRKERVLDVHLVVSVLHRRDQRQAQLEPVGVRVPLPSATGCLAESLMLMVGQRGGSLSCRSKMSIG